MKSETRTRILDCALALLRAGEAISLESAARRAGLTKPGLMYYFPTKQELMLALVDHVVEGWARCLEGQLGRPVEDASVQDRMLAYLEFALTTDFDETDIVMLSDPRLREPLSRRWASRMAPWVALPESMSPSERGRTLAARLLADGAWFASATNVFTPDRTDRQRVLRVAKGLLKG